MESQAIRYIVRFPEPQTHYVSVEAIFPVGGRSGVEVFMPVWTPGSYLIREYARQMDSVTALSAEGRALGVTKSRKNRWRIETPDAAQVHLHYRLYCREMSVRTNWVDDSFALLNGAASFVTLADGVKRAHEVDLELPAAWKNSMTALPEIAGGAAHRYLAADYDVLVDSPIVAGNPAIHEFELDGIRHHLVNQGDDGLWDGARSVGDVEKIVRHYRAMWGAPPYRKYVFLNLITEGRGGLEHSDSQCVMTSRWTLKTRAAYVDWLALVSHEFFHVWNIKRLRPVELGPFDYEAENQTRSLWIAEGLTDYYGPLALHRAGLTSRSEYLGDGIDAERSSISAAIDVLQATPGRLLQSVEGASWDAWIKLYRPDENTGNTSVSYYTKGAVVGWLLDARIRRETSGAASLDDVMRLAFQGYAGERGFTAEEFKAVCEQVAGASLREFFRQTVESSGELDYGEALDWFGLRFKSPVSVKKAVLGVETRADNGTLVVSRVPAGSAAFGSGLSVDDEILGMDGFRLRAEQLNARLENYQAGDHVRILVARREKLVTVEMALGATPERWQMEVRPDASPEQRGRLDAWLAQSVS